MQLRTANEAREAVKLSSWVLISNRKFIFLVGKTSDVQLLCVF